MRAFIDQWRGVSRHSRLWRFFFLSDLYAGHTSYWRNTHIRLETFWYKVFASVFITLVAFAHDTVQCCFCFSLSLTHSTMANDRTIKRSEVPLCAFIILLLTHCYSVFAILDRRGSKAVITYRTIISTSTHTHTSFIHPCFFFYFLLLFDFTLISSRLYRNTHVFKTHCMVYVCANVRTV